MTKVIDQKTGQEVEGRVCSRCSEYKLFSEYNKQTSGKYGFNSQCRACQKISNRIAYEKDGYEKRAPNIRRWRSENAERKRKTDADWRARNADKVRESQERHYRNNPDAVLRKRKDAAEWKRKNPDKARAISIKSQIKRMQQPSVKINSNVSRAIRSGLAKGAKEGKKTFDILGYSREELMRHLEDRFLPGMSWENYGVHGWHIDHIIPKVMFNITSIYDIDFKKCWALENLRPMWATDNRKKWKKIETPFQPSLHIQIPATTKDN